MLIQCALHEVIFEYCLAMACLSGALCLKLASYGAAYLNQILNMSLMRCFVQVICPSMSRHKSQPQRDRPGRFEGKTVRLLVLLLATASLPWQASAFSTSMPASSRFTFSKAGVHLLSVFCTETLYFTVEMKSVRFPAAMAVARTRAAALTKFQVWSCIGIISGVYTALSLLDTLM